MTLAAQGKAFPRPRKAYLRRCRRLGSDCLLGCRLLLLAAALTAGHHQRQRACSRANRGLPSSRWRLEGEGTSTAATHASRMAQFVEGHSMGDTVVASGYGARRVRDVFCALHHAHAADTCGSQVLRTCVPCGMRARSLVLKRTLRCQPPPLRCSYVVPTADGPNTKINIAERGTYLYSRT